MTMKTYVVKTGDTLFAIAKSQNTTQTLILKYNPSITNPSLIIAGMELQIKTSAEINDLIGRVPPRISYAS